MPRPAWEWFCVSNVVAVAAFLASVTYLMGFWMENMRQHTPAYAFSQPVFALSMVTALGSLLYFFAFFGVAFVHGDVADLAAEPQPAAGNGGRAGGRAVSTDGSDADVVIVGAGTAGAALAAVLARSGKRVTMVERCVSMLVQPARQGVSPATTRACTPPHACARACIQCPATIFRREMGSIDRIVGEVLQPGGVRALERMGLAQAAKTADIDSVRVDGCVCYRSAVCRQHSSVTARATHTPRNTACSIATAPREGTCA